MTRISGHVTPLRSTNKDGSGLSPTYLLCRKCRKSGFTKPSELLAHADEAHGVSSMPFPCTACRLNGYKWRESLNKHRRSGCCRGPNWENNWKTGVSYTQLSDSVAMNSQHSDSSTRLNGRTTPTSARSKKRPPPPSTTSPPSFKRVRKSAPVCEDSTSRNTFNGKSDFGKDTSLSSVHHDASKIVAAGRLSLLDWDAFIGLSKKRRRLSLLPRGPEDSLCDAFTVGHTLPNGLSRGHLVTGLPSPTQDKVSSALRRRDVSSSVGLSNLINGKKSTDVTVTKHPKAIAGSTITFDESSHMLSETLSPQRSFLCNGYEAKLPDLGFSTSPSINPFPSTCRRLPTDLSNHMNKSHNLGIHPCVSNSSAAIDSLTKQSIPPSTSPVDSDCPCSITTCLHGHKAPNTPVGRKTRRPTPSHMMHDDFDPSDSSVQASLSVVDHTTESMKVVTEGSATKRSPQSRSNVAIEKPSVDICPSSESGGVHDSSEDTDQSRQSYDPRLAGLCPNCSRIFPNATGLNGHLRWCKDKFNLSNATGSQVSSEPDSCSLSQPTSSVSDAHVTGESVNVADSTTGALKRADKNGSAAAQATEADAGPDESEMTEMPTLDNRQSTPDVVRKSTESNMCVASEGTESWTTAPVTETGIVAILPSTSPVDSDCPSDSITTYLNGHKAPNTPVGRKTRRHTPSHMTHDGFDPSDSSVQGSLSVVDHTTESMKVVTEGSATKRSPQSRSNVAIEKPSVDQCPSSELCSTAGVLPSVSVDDPPEDGGGSRQSYDPRFATLCPNCSRMFQNVNCLHGHLRWCKDDSTLATSPSASGAPSNQNADSASVSTISTTHPIELHLGDRAGTPVSSLTDAGTSSSTLPAEDDPTPRLSVTRRSHKRKSHSLSLHRQTSLSEPARSSAFGLTTSSKGTDRDMIDPVGKNSSDIGPAGPCKPIFEAVTLRPRRHSLPAVKRSSSALVQYSCHSEEQFPRLRLRIRMSVDGSTNYSSSPVATTPLSHGATSLNAGTSGSRYHFRSTRLSAESVCSSVDETRSVISDATTLPAVQKATSRKRKTGPYRRRCAWCHVLFHDRRKLYAHKVKCHARAKSLTHSHCVNQMETRNKLGLSTRLWQCACGMKYRSRAVLRAHVAVGCPKSRRFQSIMRVSSQVGCPGCPKNAAPFDSADAVLTHLLSLKPGSGHPYASHGLLSTPRSWPSYLSVPNLGFGCHICGLLLASESRLDKHKRAMHETWLLAEQKNALSPAKATAL